VDCLSESELLNKTKEYKLAFTVEEKVNIKSTSAYDIGRYQVQQKDTVSTLEERLRTLVKCDV